MVIGSQKKSEKRRVASLLRPTPYGLRFTIDKQPGRHTFAIFTSGLSPDALLSFRSSLFVSRSTLHVWPLASGLLPEALLSLRSSLFVSRSTLHALRNNLIPPHSSPHPRPYRSCRPSVLSGSVYLLRRNMPRGLRHNIMLSLD